MVRPVQETNPGVRVRPANVGEAPELMFWMVLIVPAPLSWKLVELNVAIPLVEAFAAALSIVIVPVAPLALLRVKAPVCALPPDAPVMERTPVLEIVTVPPKDTGEPETPIPEPLETVIDEF